MKIRSILGLASTLGLLVVGCGGSSTGTDVAFEIEGHHYHYTHAYYDVLGGTVVAGKPATFTFELSDLDCMTATRNVGDDLDVQLLQAAPELGPDNYGVRIESPDPAGNNTFWQGEGEVTLNEGLPQPMYTADIPALNDRLTGSVDYQVTGGTDPSTVIIVGTFTAVHCGRMDSTQ